MYKRQVSALRAGIISGVNSDDGLVFRPNTALTQAEAAVMLQNVLDLPASSSVASFLPIRIFSRIVLSKSVTSWNTME